MRRWRRLLGLGRAPSRVLRFHGVVRDWLGRPDVAMGAETLAPHRRAVPRHASAPAAPAAAAATSATSASSSAWREGHDTTIPPVGTRRMGWTRAPRTPPHYTAMRARNGRVAPPTTPAATVAVRDAALGERCGCIWAASRAPGPPRGHCPERRRRNLAPRRRRADPACADGPLRERRRRGGHAGVGESRTRTTGSRPDPITVLVNAYKRSGCPLCACSWDKRALPERCGVG